MNYIQEQFEKRIGLKHTNPECRFELTIFRKGVEAGKAFESDKIAELEEENRKLKGYTNHKTGCPVFIAGRIANCNCGLDELLNNNSGV